MANWVNKRVHMGRMHSKVVMKVALIKTKVKACAKVGEKFICLFFSSAHLVLCCVGEGLWNKDLLRAELPCGRQSQSVKSPSLRCLSLMAPGICLESVFPLYPFLSLSYCHFLSPSLRCWFRLSRKYRHCVNVYDDKFMFNTELFYFLVYGSEGLCQSRWEIHVFF